ncbi:Pyridoxamine 5'-phosphate oxidase [Planctomycetes bacterium Poly30]|uniref:Pyridoxamine 5'-phosphate oxidase n=1 Tax=Saltatorellus ferox TaxID=2528018 RepID=A0A518EZE5_9BACT|nr:Pyridoxamine 5'-phosphate oxidase [Planctomycetes bacterium Poly30]
MGKTYESITEEMRAFIEAQPLFFVATAPRDGGHVNLSPKGLNSLVILGPRQVAYLDLTGSGAETIAHVRENGRITLMFCAFEGSPNIVRLYGRGEVVLTDDERFADLQAKLPALAGVRSILLIQVERTSTSCGYGVPFMEYVKDRTTLVDWAEAKGESGVREYRKEKNTLSIDGLPAIDRG